MGTITLSSFYLVTQSRRSRDELDTAGDHKATMAAWLDLTHDATGWSLGDTGRMDDIVQSMTHPATQYPSVCSFLGNASRLSALRALFPQNNVTRRGPAGLVRLHLSTTTASTEHPVWFAEASFAHPPTLDGPFMTPSANRPRQYPVQQGQWETAIDIRDHILTRLVFPWTHVACFFVDGESELNTVSRWLEASQGGIHASPSDTPSRMRVILILTSPTATYNANPLEVAGPSSDIVEEQWPTITVLDLRDRHQLSPSALYAPLQRLLLNTLQDNRVERIQQGLLFSTVYLKLFSTVHLNFMWQKCLPSSLLRSAARPIPCLSLARERLPVPTGFENGCTELLREASKIGCPIRDLYPFVASALLMDAYPPGMHRFRPQHVFDDLYRDRWPTPSDLYKGRVGAGQQCDAIRDAFVDGFAQMGPLQSSLTIRKGALRHLGAQWPNLTLPTMCLFCLGRPAEYQRPCRHALCDTCVVVFGSPTRGAEYHHDLSQCPLCQDVVERTIRRLPPTKQPVVLALDGGGIRGIVTLGLLQELERRLMGSMALSDIPDLTAGTSVGKSTPGDVTLDATAVVRCGAVIATDFTHNNISAAEAYQKFPDFARKAFRTSGVPSGRWPWLRVAMHLLKDSLYDADMLDQTIRTVCEHNRRVFDAASPSGGGRRLAIIVSQISDDKPVVFSNYRGVGRDDVDLGYQIILYQDEAQNPLLSDVIAQAEYRIIWPSARTHDLLISVGTDYIPSRRAYYSSPCMDGTEVYKEDLYHVPHATRLRTLRLDHPLDGHLPRLDDIGQLTALTRRSYWVPDELVRAVLATCFFFELDEAPTMVRGQYHCRRSILCARPQARRIIERVLVEFLGAKVGTLRGDELDRLSKNDGCTVCGYYQKRIRFCVGSLDEDVTILFTGSSHQHPIGGFPATVQQFLRQQQADAVFSQSDH
ncbi:hypothetical protein FE257_005569 [Aspergillus nanangensis]|uniref:RING-type domain-containing protein n=1 Tax=Aspergillus nanangensis TaxID=2582783 RepID=A0AAD4CRY9_ASPNN|nr:hypothetical protein FE257_005569 [Aspergillus nanangensis]